MTIRDAIKQYLSGNMSLDELLRRFPSKAEQKTIFYALRGKI